MFLKMRNYCEQCKKTNDSKPASKWQWQNQNGIATKTCHAKFGKIRKSKLHESIIQPLQNWISRIITKSFFYVKKSNHFFMKKENRFFENKILLRKKRKQIFLWKKRKFFFSKINFLREKKKKIIFCEKKTFFSKINLFREEKSNCFVRWRWEGFFEEEIFQIDSI